MAVEAKVVVGGRAALCGEGLCEEWNREGEGEGIEIKARRLIRILLEKFPFP